MSHEHSHCHEHNHGHACGCGHCHTENHKPLYVRLALGVILSVIFNLLHSNELLLIIPYFILGYDVLRSSAKHIAHGKIFDEQFLMSAATLGALALGEYSEAVAVMFFYQLGELLGDITAEKCRKSIKEMFDFVPDSARRITDSGFEIIKPDELKTGDKMAVFAGEKIPCDAIITEGNSYLNTASLTGESLPQHVGIGSKVLGGSINTDSPITLTVTAEYKNSSIAKVSALLEEAAHKKAKSEKFITAFAKRYTPIVVLTALLSAILLPLLPQFTIESGIYTALMFLVISCPCSLVISIPLTLFAGIGNAAKNKILFRGNSALERLYKIKNFAFDKTGTLTEGKFSISGSTLNDADFETLAQLERFSSHPLAASVAGHAHEPYKKAIGITELKGLGISAEIDGKAVIAGSEKFMELKGITNADKPDSTAVHLAIDQEYKGYVTLEDAPKTEALEAVSYLKSIGADITLLSGDAENSVKKCAEGIGITSYHSALLPHDKVRLAKELSASSPLLYTGDGINDAPVLALADIGVSMGGIGSDVALANSDIILLDDNLNTLTTAIKISKKTMRIVYQNIVLSIGIKALVMLLGFWGLASMPAAIFADVGVMILTVLNSIRAIR